jgi:hypothetical protein
MFNKFFFLGVYCGMLTACTWTQNVPEPKQTENIVCWHHTSKDFSGHDVTVWRCYDRVLKFRWDRVVR